MYAAHVLRDWNFQQDWSLLKNGTNGGEDTQDSIFYAEGAIK